MKKNIEYEAFDRTMHDLMRVSHDEIKQELEAEKLQRTRKKRKAKVPSASDRVDRDGG